MRILIVDDNAAVRRSLVQFLASQSGWQVCGEAQDGFDGLEKARQMRPDVVLLDISMHGWDGLETARRLRHEHPRMKILMLSMRDPGEVLPQAIEAGADGCVDKSRISDDLVRALNSL